MAGAGARQSARTAAEWPRPSSTTTTRSRSSAPAPSRRNVQWAVALPLRAGSALPNLVLTHAPAGVPRGFLDPVEHVREERVRQHPCEEVLTDDQRSALSPHRNGA